MCERKQEKNSQLKAKLARHLRLVEETGYLARGRGTGCSFSSLSGGSGGGE